ncbi:MAG: helix-turn-helix transcriptional regulator [Solirubrobacteraceae bacterium]
MDLPTRPNDALAQPTRAKLFSAMSELRRPVGTGELAERFGLNANGVRVHLELLREAGLVVRERTRQARGRPRDMWSIAPHAHPGGDPPSAYADLGRWLASALTDGRGGLRAVEVAGRKIGRELAPVGGPGSPEEKMHAALGSLGFAPRREADARGTLTYRLCNCPYRDVVSENQPVVCTLHRGMTRGLLDSLSPKTKLAGFVPRDPYTAGCLIEVQGELADEGVARLDLDAAAEPAES